MNLAPPDLRLTTKRILAASIEMSVDAPQKKWDQVHALGYGKCFPLDQVDIPWAKEAGKSVYHIHSSEKGNYATAFCLQENVFVIANVSNI